MKATKVFGILMFVSGILVIVCAIVNLTGTVAIFTGVIGTQEGSGASVVAFLFGLVALAIFAFAYKKAIWNWLIRGSLIVVGLITFVTSIAGLTGNWNFRTDLADTFTWGHLGETIREVHNPVWWIDFDVIIFFMFLGSIGILTTAIWGAFKWEEAKTNERTQDQLQTVLNELPPTAFSPEANLRFELEQHLQNTQNPPSAPDPAAGQHAPSAPAGQPAAIQGTPSYPQSASGPPQGSNPSSASSSGRGHRCPKCYQTVSAGVQVCPNCGAGG